MKRVLPILLFFLVVSLVARFVMTGPRAQLVRAELERRGWRGAEGAEATEAA